MVSHFHLPLIHIKRSMPEHCPTLGLAVRDLKPRAAAERALLFSRLVFWTRYLGECMGSDLELESRMPKTKSRNGVWTISDSNLE